MSGSSPLPEGCAVRAATVDDLPALAAVEAAAFPDPWRDASLRGELGQAVTRAWVLERDGAIVASLLAWLIDGTLQVNRVAVLPAHRRLGLGRALLQVAASAAYQEGGRQLLLEVRASNEAALGLYHQAGFKLLARRRGYYPDGEDALMLDKWL
jgi:ribosomal-protein-alanine N-acetyltransferase